MTRRSNSRWCSDASEIVCWNAQRVSVAFTVNCCDREIISFLATTGDISGHMIRDLMAKAIESRFGFVERLPHGIEWLSDNGPAYTAHETRVFAKMMGLDVQTTPFHSPEPKRDDRDLCQDVQTGLCSYPSARQRHDRHRAATQLV